MLSTPSGLCESNAFGRSAYKSARRTGAGSAAYGRSRLGRPELRDDETRPAVARLVTVLDALDAVRHPQRAHLPVHRRPVEAEHFTASHPICQRDHDGDVEAVTARGVEELSSLLDRQRPAILGPNSRRRGQRGHVAWDDPARSAWPSALRSTLRMIRMLFAL